MPSWTTGLRRVFVDTAPFIYYVEEHARYASIVEQLFTEVTAGQVVAVVSPVTVAECLVGPFQCQDKLLSAKILRILSAAVGVELCLLDQAIAQAAASIRADTGLHLLDAFQVAAARHAGCDGLLTNDVIFRRIKQPTVLVVDDLLAGQV